MANVQIFQVVIDKDKDHRAFMGYNKNVKINPNIYKEVFNADIDYEDSLENLFMLFNYPDDIQRMIKEYGYKGRSMSVSDIIKTDKGLFYVDNVGFTKLKITDIELPVFN